MAKKKGYEPYVTGSILMAAWQLVFLKLLLSFSWEDSIFISIISGLLFFLIAVLVLESSKFKGGF